MLSTPLGSCSSMSSSSYSPKNNSSSKNHHNHTSNGAKRQRTRINKKGLEGLQFSTVRPSQLTREDALPSTSGGITSAEQLKALMETSPPFSRGKERMIHGSSGVAGVPSSSSTMSTSAAGGGFDPIPQDVVFVVVQQSAYWPPPSLAELREKTGISASEELDLYDRREEEAVAKKEKTEQMKKKGELQHPRGKAPKNNIERFHSDNSSSSDDDGNCKREDKNMEEEAC